MARLVGAIRITGTVEGLCFYKMQGEHFVRRKSSLSGKRFRTDKVFEGSRRSAALLQMASPLASRLYHRLPKEKKAREVFRALTGRVKLLLKEGLGKEQIEHWFVQTYFPEPAGAVAESGCAEKKKAARSSFAARQKPPALVLLPRPVTAIDPKRRRPGSRCRWQVRERGSPGVHVQ